MDDVPAGLLPGLALHRASGAPALACLAGVRTVDPGGPGVALAAAADATGTTGATDLAMLVDLAAGAAIRARTGGDRRLATTALAVHLLGGLPPLAQLVVHAGEAAAGVRHASAATTLRAGGEVLGHGSVAFAVLGGGLAPIPWEHPGTTARAPLAVDELTADERAAGALAGAAGGRSWSEAVLRGATTDDGLELHPTSLLANRAGGVQGGVLVGLVALAAEDPDDGSTPASLQVDFVAAATVDAPVRASVVPLRTGRRSRLLRVELHQGGTLVVTATVGLRTA